MLLVQILSHNLKMTKATKARLLLSLLYKSKLTNSHGFTAHKSFTDINFAGHHFYSWSACFKTNSSITSCGGKKRSKIAYLELMCSDLSTAS